MNTSLDTAKQLIAGLSRAVRADLLRWASEEYGTGHPLEQLWGIKSPLLLDAIERSSDLTKRGMRGLIAEAIFGRDVVPTVPDWIPSVTTGEAFDFLLRRGDQIARIQVKLQRMEGGSPKRASTRHPPGTYVVEVQRTRTGKDRKTGKPTRPYRFDEFDVLAVNMHPSTNDWTRFLFIPSAWLVPRGDAELIDVMQPVPARPDERWTDDLGECLRRFAERSRAPIVGGS